MVPYLAGELPQRQIGVGWASLRSLVAAAPESSLTVQHVDAEFSAIGAESGSGSQARRAGRLAAIYAAATPDEGAFLTQLLTGNLRQGALLGVMSDAVAKATGTPLAAVRRASMLAGNLVPVAVALLRDGASALESFTLQVGRPVLPMLAGTAPDVAAALERTGPAAVDQKLDGARIQIHVNGEDIAIYTRSLDDVTDRLPEIVSVVRALPVRSAIFDGEALALRADGRPHPFQVTASRFGSRRVTDALLESLPLQAFLFDVLHLDGTDLLDEPLSTRLEALIGCLPESLQVPRVITQDPVVAQDFAMASLAAGHEGVVLKSLDSRYEAGRRGTGWIKVKPVHTLDLVILAVEWGSGRRTGLLSNLHLGARDPSGGFVMLGKTFKGLTDEMLRWQTDRLLSIAVGPTDGYVVTVRPELVAEIAIDGVQTSTRYPGGMALRFARVVRYREDKTANEADTVDAVRAIHRGEVSSD